MRDLWIVLKWEFKRSLSNKAMIITTILIPLIIIGAAFLPQLIMDNKEYRLVVVDDTGQVYQQLAGFLEFQDVQAILDQTLKPEELAEKASTDKKQSYLYIPQDFYESKQAYYYFQSSTSIDQTNFNLFMSQLVKNYELKSLGLSDDTIQELEEGIDLQRIAVDQQETNMEERLLDQIGLVAFGFLIVFTSMMTGGVLLQSIIKEKNDRVVEILFSSVSSVSLMTGKIIGTLLVGLIQVVVFGVIGLGVAKFAYDLPIGKFFKPDLLLYLLFGVLALILIYTLYAFLGAIMKEVQSGGQAQPLLIVLPVVPMWFAGMIFMEPMGSLARIFSYIPPFTPMTMMLRMASANIPVFEIVMSLLELAAVDVLAVYFVAKIFKTGLLMYGKDAGFKEAWRWFKQAGQH